MMTNILMACTTSNILIGLSVGIPLFGLFAIGIVALCKYDSHLEKLRVQHHRDLIEYLDKVKTECEEKRINSDDRKDEQQFGVVKKEYRCPIKPVDGQPCPMCRLSIVKR